jgi:hypothetical protein
MLPYRIGKDSPWSKKQNIIPEVDVEGSKRKILHDDGHRTELGRKGGAEYLDQGVVFPRGRSVSKINKDVDCWIPGKGNAYCLGKCRFMGR